MSCDPPVCLACLPPVLQFLTRPPCVIDFSLSLIPWVNMLSLLVHKSHAHTLSPATITKQSTGKLKIWFWQSPRKCFTLHQVCLVGVNHFCLSSSHNIFEKIINAISLGIRNLVGDNYKALVPTCQHYVKRSDYSLVY